MPATNKTCQILNWVITVLLFFAALAALTGMYKAHFVAGGATFGSTTGSMSIIAFSISVMLWKKQMEKCCKCACTMCTPEK